MKLKVKLSVAVMLALASVASCATIVRLKYLTLYSDPGEFLYGTGKIGFWSLIELGIGLIAGSLPALRPLLSLRIKISTSSTHPQPSADAYSRSKPTQPHSRIMMDTFQTLEDADDMDDGDSQRKIVKETQYTVTSTKIMDLENQDRRQMSPENRI